MKNLQTFNEFVNESVVNEARYNIHFLVHKYGHKKLDTIKKP